MSEAVKILLKTLDLELQNAKLDFLSTLAAKQIRHIRHQHVAPERIYRELLNQQNKISP